MHIQIGLGTKFPLKLTIFILKTRFAQKEVFWSKTEKVNTPYSLHNSAYSNKSSAKFQLKLTILIFWTKYSKTEKVNNNKWKQKEHHHGIHAYLNWSWYKIQLKLIILSFWIKFTLKRYFQLTTEQTVQGLQAFGFCVANVYSNVVFKHFEDLKDLIILNISKEKLVFSCPLDFFYLKIV